MAARFEFGSIGAGNMAASIIAAVISRNRFAPSAIIVADPEPSRRQVFVEKYGVMATADNNEVASESKRIMMAVKPQRFTDVAAGLSGSISSDSLVISIMAGTSIETIESAFISAKPRVVRVMPNLPIQVGAGMAGICPGPTATDGDVRDTELIFQAGGQTVVVRDEALMDAVTAISGSGPAYFYYFVEAMVQAGVECGLTEVDALKLATQTCLGAARMMLDTGEPPAELRRKVTSKGGTTQAALETMGKAGVLEGIRDGVKAAYQRGRELGA